MEMQAKKWQARVEGRMGKDDYVEALLPRCYYFEKGQGGFRIVEEHHAAVIVAVRDLYGSSKRQDWLRQKIEMAIEYPVAGEDLVVLNKISQIRPKEHHGKHYLTYALYLYLAGLVTVHPNNAGSNGRHLSFLDACKESGFINPYDLTDDEQKFARVLQKLGLWNLTDLNGNFYIQNLLTEWKNKGTFTVVGLSAANAGAIEETKEGQRFITGGEYLNLAIILSVPTSPVMETNNCVSFLVAVKEEVANLSTAQEREQQMLKIIHAAANSQNIAMRYVKRGDEIIFRRVMNAIKVEFGETEITELNDEQRQKSRGNFRSFLQILPESALKILYYTNQSIAHTEDADLRNVMPKGKIPGSTEVESEASRKSQGMYDRRFKVLFAASGKHLTNADDRDTHLQKKKMTTLHETLHIAFGVNGANSFGDDFDDLKLRVQQLGEDCLGVFYKLRKTLRTKPEILDQKSMLLDRSLSDILNPRTTYDKYSNDVVPGNLLPNRCEEILANIWGLIHTEFSPDREKDNPFFSGSNPRPEFADLYTLTADLKTLYTEISQRVEARAIEMAKKQNLVS